MLTSNNYIFIQIRSANPNEAGALLLLGPSFLALHNRRALAVVGSATLSPRYDGAAARPAVARHSLVSVGAYR